MIIKNNLDIQLIYIKLNPIRMVYNKLNYF